MKKSKDILYKSFIAIICSVQAMVALTLSSNQVIEVYHEIGRNPVYYLLGTFMLFLLFFAIALITRKSLLAMSIISGLFTVIAIINYYELLLHGTVLTYQDIKNISIAWRHFRNYK